MRKRNILVLDGNAVRGVDLRDYFRDNGYDATHMTGLQDAQRSKQYDGIIIASRNLNVFGNYQSGEELCQRVVEAKVRIPRFYIGEGQEDVKNVATRDFNKKEDAKNPYEVKLFRAIVDRKNLEYRNELTALLNDNVSIPLKIGFVSAGRLTTGIIRTLYSKYQDYFTRLGVVSMAHTEGHTDAGLRAACEISKEDPRFKVYENSGDKVENIAEMLSEGYDLILHTSSRSKGTKIKEGRNYLWEADKEVVRDLCSAVVEAEKRREVFPLHIMGVNPVGVNMMLGIALGLAKERLTGFSYVDPTRARQWIRDKYHEKTGQFVDEKSIDAKVIGQHGAEILIKSTVKIDGKRLEELGFDIDEEEAIRGIREISKETAEARERVRKEEGYELLHTQAAEAFCGLCVEMAKQKQPSASLYTIKNLNGFMAGEGHCAFNGPASLDYNGISGKGITVVEQPVGANLPSVTKSEMNTIIEEIRTEATFQKQSVEAFMQKSNGWWRSLFG
jgi:malate/lactate dehydrogenase